MTAPCVVCGWDSTDAHHLTGKPPASEGGASRKHLDPHLTVPVCDDCHDLFHEDLRSQHLDTPDGDTAWTVLDRIGFSLARVGCFFGRLAEASAWAWCVHIADTCRSWADQLDDLRRTLDHHLPDWAELTTGEHP